MSWSDFRRTSASRGMNALAGAMTAVLALGLLLVVRPHVGFLNALAGSMCGGFSIYLYRERKGKSTVVPR